MTEPEIRTDENPSPQNAERAGETLAPRTDDDVAALRQRADRAERENTLRRALGSIDWFDAEDAYRELSRHAERAESGEWEISVPNPAGGERLRVTPDEAARQLAARKPHWVRARVVGGSGANGGEGSRGGAPAGLSYGDLLKPENAERLREYIHNRPRELERLRQAYFK
ncbi:MAG TPA: hypothetical protein VKX17_02675 [Planctomycetota bacterium]|nr:hypothetical protein [Planctomycetota bacterium]